MTGAFQALNPGSNPGWRIVLYFSFLRSFSVHLLFTCMFTCMFFSGLSGILYIVVTREYLVSTIMVGFYVFKVTFHIQAGSAC